MANNLADTLKKKKKELEQRFESEKKAIVEIDEQINALQQARSERVQEMTKLQGEHRLAQQLLENE